MSIIIKSLSELFDKLSLNYKIVSDDKLRIDKFSSNWNNHELVDLYDDGVRDNTLGVSVDADYFCQKHLNSLQYYFENEKTIYKNVLSRLLNDWESFIDGITNEELREEYGLGETVDEKYLKQHIKLIGISTTKCSSPVDDEYACIELDFELSWEEEHGLRCLVHKDKVSKFYEGGAWLECEDFK